MRIIEIQSSFQHKKRLDPDLTYVKLATLFWFAFLTRLRVWS